VAAILAIATVLVASLAVGWLGVRTMRGTEDFLVASRTLSPRVNATAVAGEYLSAASFLGVAGAVMKLGVGAMWYPIGYTAGYLTLLVLIAAPLRRFGGFTVPDFVEGRLGSLPLRRVVAGASFLISGLYVVPQLKGAGLVLADVVSVPYPVGVVATGAVIAVVVAVGGMRGATYLQAFEYAVKVGCVAVPAIVLLMVLRPSGAAVLRSDGTVFPRETTVSLASDTSLTTVQPTPVSIDGGPVRIVPSGTTRFAAGSRLTFAAGERVPAVTGQQEPGGSGWRRPLLSLPGVGHPLFTTWAVLLTLTLGTAGLPHILVRFGTNPTGQQSRRTAVVTVGLVGFFYLFPNVFGLLGRAFAPQLYLTASTDSVVAVLPAIALRTGGGILTALTAAGAFAAFLSTSTGLLLTAGSAIGRDIAPRLPTRTGGLGVLRYGIVVATVAAIGVSLATRGVDISVCVGWAFTLATSTIMPLLVLSIWTDRVSPRGAIAGVVVGTVLAMGAVVSGLVGTFGPGWPAAVLANPAPLVLPLTVATMLVVSTRTPRAVGVAESVAAMARMHGID
jgi:cation/acetate symporter